MAAASSKPRPRRSMRVATIFTGVAAATVGVTQVANAQEIRPANLQDHRPANARGMRPAGTIYGNTALAQNCGFAGSDPTWVHVSAIYSLYNPIVVSDCFGNRGEYQSPPYIGARGECGGNNHGFVLGVNGGRSKSFVFGPGTTYHKLSWSHFYTVDINSWTGHDTCPEAAGFGRPG